MKADNLLIVIPRRLTEAEEDELVARATQMFPWLTPYDLRNRLRRLYRMHPSDMPTLRLSTRQGIGFGDAGDNSMGFYRSWGHMVVRVELEDFLSYNDG